MSDAPHHNDDPAAGAHPSGATGPAHAKVPTVEEILEKMKKQGVTDLEGLAKRIVDEASASEDDSSSTFIFDGDAYIYKHTESTTETSVKCW